MCYIINMLNESSHCLLYLDIVVVSWKALGLLWCDVDVGAHQGAKEALQLLLDPPQFILTTHKTHMSAAPDKHALNS